MPIYVYLIILVVVIAVIQGIRMSHTAATHHFVCPKCDKQFQVSFARYMFTAHNFEGMCQVTCPACGKTGMMRAQAGKVSGGTDSARS